MANQIILKRSSTPAKVPTTAQLALGEIAINTYDGRIFIKKDDGTPSVVEIGGVTSVNGEIGSVTLTTDDVSDAGQTNKWFTNALARAAVSAGSGISYNSSTGVISTAQTLTTTATPTFAGLVLTGDVDITGDIIPSADVTYDLGSPTKQWKDIYVGPGSLYVNGSKVLQDDTGTITFSADLDQNIRIKTTGTGVLQLGSSTTNVNIDGTLQIASGKNITDSAGVEVNFGDNIDMNNNKVVGLGTPSASTDAATKGYVDTQIGAISTSSIAQGNSNVSVVDTGTGTVTVTVDGSTALTVTATGVVIAGNMTVEGTTTTVNSNTVSIADNIVTLNSDATGTPTQNAGIEVERGDEANVQLRWNEGSDKWTFTNDGAVYHPVAVNTDDLTEGSTNQYFTTTRARTSLSAGTATGVSYNSSTGLISLGSIPNSSLSNNTITINGASVALGGTRTLDTDAVGEGSNNVYFTTARARSSVSAGGSLAYNSTTGVISYTTPTTIASLSNHTTTNLAEGTNLYYTDARAVSANTTAIATAKSEAISAAATDATTKVAAEATARAAAIAAAVAGKDNTDEITEGTTNLYFTNARAVSANTTAIATAKSEAISAAATDATTKADAAQAAAATDATTKVAAEATARAAAIAAAVAGKDNTDEITEGSSNLYFTTARARSSVSAGTGISYNSTTGVITNTITQYTDALARGAVSAGGSLAYNSTTGVISYTTPSTSGITEGTNLYFTDARARAAVSAGTGISYNSTTGVITNTITQYTDALAVSANTSAIATAKSEAISAASSDATTKANAARDAAISAVTNGAGAAFDTLKEIQDAMATDTELSAAIAAITNVPSATKLQTARTINGVSFDGTGNISFSTSAVSEGTNLYYTDGRARAAVSFTAGSGAYNSSTGVFTIPTNTNQLTNGAGYVTSSGVTSIATSNGISGGTITSTGTLSLSGSYSGTWAVSGAITATGEVTAYFSDQRLKTNIVPIADALDKVESISGYTFDPNEAALALGIEARHQMGVIAQEIEAVAPELVCDSAFEGYKTVRYDKLTALLIEAVKELSAKVKTLEAKLGDTKPQL